MERENQASGSGFLLGTFRTRSELQIYKNKYLCVSNVLGQGQEGTTVLMHHVADYHYRTIPLLLHCKR